MIVMRAGIVFAVLATMATAAHAADVALVRATFSLERHPTSGIDTYYEAVKRGLDANAVRYDLVTDEQIVAGELAAHKLAIFPYTLDTTPEHTQAILDFMAGGGKVLWFFTVPRPLWEPLGIVAMAYNRDLYPGQLHTMVFAEDAPPGFPARVRQESLSAYQATELTADARVLADWVDSEGKSSDFPAVVLTPRSVWIAHVLWANADTAAQHHLLLAVIGHFVPGAWEGMVEDAFAGALASTGYESLDAVEAASAGSAAATDLIVQARTQQANARVALAEERFSEALALAQQFQQTLQSAVAAGYPSRPFEMRGAWMSFPRDDMDWDAIMAELAAAHFTAVFPNMCTPGAAAYPSEVLPQVTQRDHLSECIAAAHAHGIEVHPWRGNWQVYQAAEGVVDRFFDEGRFVVSVEQAMGQEELDQQYRWSHRWLDPSDERNRQLEIAAMEEMARNFDVDGIHYDFMRYPSNRYCYCERCRRLFEEWAQVTVANWPADCWEGGALLGRYRDWRRHLQTSLVAEMRERLAAIDPELQISLAARASVTGAVESDAQDWPTWSRAGYLDFLCPMDYTGDVEVFRAKLAPQMEAVGDLIPVYAGIGVASTRSSTPVNFSQQVVLARELGADGFLVFALNEFSRQIIRSTVDGVLATPVDVMPHQQQSAVASFVYPPSPAGAPEHSYPPDAAPRIGITVSATGDQFAQLTAQPLLMPVRGGEPTVLAPYRSVEEGACELEASMQVGPGIYSVIARGEVVFADGHEEPFYLRSRPITILTPEAQAALQATLTPPQFTTTGLRVGVIAGGYGSEGILQALADEPGIEVRPIHRVTAEFLAPCEVVVFPQLRAGAAALPAGAAEALREFVRAGGGVLATHDAVGVRGYEALFPEIATGGERVRETSVTVIAEHPVTAGSGLGEDAPHSYYDHITLAPGSAGTAVLADATGGAVVVAGEAGRGRYVAWGMATGLGADDAEVAPAGCERELLINALRRLGRRG